MSNNTNFTDKQIETYLEIWKTTIEVQQHFNDLELRIRNFGITVIGAFLAATAVSLQNHLILTIRGVQYPTAAFILLAAVMIWLAFYFMDYHWYHPLLRGAVDHGLKVEKRIAAEYPEISLTESVGKASPMVFLGRRIHSSGKMKLFYFQVGILLYLFAAILLHEPPAYMSVFFAGASFFFLHYFMKKKDSNKRAILIFKITRFIGALLLCGTILSFFWTFSRAAPLGQSAQPPKKQAIRKPASVGKAKLTRQASAGRTTSNPRQFLKPHNSPNLRMQKKHAHRWRLHSAKHTFRHGIRKRKTTSA